MAAACRRLASTFRQVRRYRQLLLFLVAFWLYNDGIGTIARMATVYGDEVGIGRNHLITALILTQVIGVPCTFGFGRLARVLGTKRSILVGLGVYGLISVGGYFMQTALHFYILAGVVGMVLGGTQALSRSLYASMIPPEKSGEFFGFYSTSSRFAGIFGPLVFGVVEPGDRRQPPRHRGARLLLPCRRGSAASRRREGRPGRRRERMNHAALAEARDGASGCQLAPCRRGRFPESGTASGWIFFVNRGCLLPTVGVGHLVASEDGGAALQELPRPRRSR